MKALLEQTTADMTLQGLDKEAETRASEVVLTLSQAFSDDLAIT